MKLLVISFGCQMSTADGAEMARPLRARGFESASGLGDADAVILNTCTVRQHAEDRALSQIGRLKPWKEERPGRLLIVAGCAAERIGAWIEERFPYVDLVVGAKSIEAYPAILDQALKRSFDWARDDAPAWPAAAQEQAGAGAYVTVMRGCNYACTYCIVPAVRGPELYRPFDTVLAEAGAALSAGARELTLLGQTVNSWRDGSGRDFSDLVRAVDALPGVARQRFMSPHPFFLTPKLMRAMADCATVAPHLHLPAQSGSDRMLKAMKRNYTSMSYLAKTETLRTMVPGLALSTDFIVGFPGETEEDFRATLEFASAGDFCTAYCFKYSAREGTAAASAPDPVDETVKDERLARLLELVEANMRRRLDAMVGTRVRVLLEDATDGRTQFHFRARLDEPGVPGTLVDAVVTGRTDTALKARALSLASRPVAVVSLSS
ncbi:MAG: tRNA (N6-isopentenyl adenosine(37)-C2)-methylthiotransferase MiaB [Elusimicrobia bacterium]|nr:tRNA (N6-isopentenyl adenosine(37)-C2)-methylthiotransferase MiaB [Elusimicrobiota bacterium]